jgi:hypothetical protein
MAAAFARRLFPALLLAAGLAAAQPVAEHDLKAAFVFNFAVFTEWPADVLAPGAPLNLCVGAPSPLTQALGQLQDRVVNGHALAVRQAGAGLRGCHLLVLDKPDRERWQQWRRELGAATVLTISDDRRDGAVILLSVDQARVAFEVDLAAARAARLNLSSKLLRLARSVQ